MKVEVKELAETLDMSTAALLKQMKQADLPQKYGDEEVSDEQQRQLRAFRRLQREAATIRENVRLLRKCRTLTRAELARKTGISERHLARIETGDIDVSRQDLKEKLAKALSVGIADLCGITDYIGRLSETEPGAETRTQLSAAVNVHTRLAYALLKRRYGWTAAEIIKLAPVMFALLAEGSLERRRRRLAQLRDSRDKVDEDLKGYLSALSRHCSVEETSVERCDLRANEVERDEDPTNVFRSRPDGDSFIDYLTELANDLLPDDEPAHLRGERRLLARVCREELDKLTDDSILARWALEYGDTDLSAIPESLLQPEAKAQRIEWLESKLRSITKDDIQHWQRRLGAKGVLCPKCDVPVDPRSKFCSQCGYQLQPSP